jgi:hypothetical protein
VPLPLPESRFKIYPEAPEMQESADTGTVIGVRSANYALIPTSPGPVTIPPIDVVWWDTAADELRVTSVAVDPVLITGTATAPAAPDAPDPVPAASAAPAPEGAAYDGRTVLITVAVALVLTLMIGGAALIRRLPAPRILLRISDPNSPRQQRRRHLNALKASARSGDPAGFRQALGLYLADVYGTSAADAIRRFRAEPGAADAIARLDRALYASAGETPPDLGRLVEIARSAGSRPASPEPALPALYG